MLDMGFIPDVERIVGLLPPIRQTLFFSATLSDDIHKISEKFVSNPKIIEVAPPASTADTVAQHLTWTDIKGKRDALRRLLKNEDVKNAVIFCNRKRDIGILVRSLTRHGFDAVALHGDMTQSARLEALQKFKDGEVPLLIASDVAARGLDIAGLSHVFNFDVPSNAEDYVHRIGRTGRAGKSGRAFTIAAGADDKKYVAAIEKLIGKAIPLVGDAPAKDISDVAASEDSTKAKKGSRRSKSSETKIPSAPAATSKPKSKDAKSKTGGGRNRDDELPAPPDCSGNTLKDTGHIPAFLMR
jgi:superfamily II DNA/RNA helicase